jgi:hypothetical protein
MPGRSVDRGQRPWNKGLLIGQKKPLEPKHVWSIRVRLEIARSRRDGLMQLMDAARQRLFDVVIVEALDRLSRDMEDLAGLHWCTSIPRYPTCAFGHS